MGFDGFVYVLAFVSLVATSTLNLLLLFLVVVVAVTWFVKLVLLSLSGIELSFLLSILVVSSIGVVAFVLLPTVFVSVVSFEVFDLLEVESMFEFCSEVLLEVISVSVDLSVVLLEEVESVSLDCSVVWFELLLLTVDFSEVLSLVESVFTNSSDMLSFLSVVSLLFSVAFVLSFVSSLGCCWLSFTVSFALLLSFVVVLLSLTSDLLSSDAFSLVTDSLLCVSFVFDSVVFVSWAKDWFSFAWFVVLSDFSFSDWFVVLSLLLNSSTSTGSLLSLVLFPFWEVALSISSALATPPTPNTNVAPINKEAVPTVNFLIAYLLSTLGKNPCLFFISKPPLKTFHTILMMYSSIIMNLL